MILFVSFEGGEGCGKSTVINKVKEQLSSYKVLCLREPGSNSISEQIRGILLDPANIDITPEAEALLYAASRAQTFNDIKKAASSYDIILCDRFLDSSLVYQGMARGLGVKSVEKINDFSLHGFRPNITFFLDVKPSIAAERIKTRHLDRLEQENSSFHEDIYQGFKRLAEETDRIITLDATKDADTVAASATKFIISYINYYSTFLKEKNF